MWIDRPDRRPPAWQNWILPAVAAVLVGLLIGSVVLGTKLLHSSGSGPNNAGNPQVSPPGSSAPSTPPSGQHSPSTRSTGSTGSSGRPATAPAVLERSGRPAVRCRPASAATT